MNYSGSELAELGGGILFNNNQQQIQFIEYDTRKIYFTKNTAFVAIKTKNQDGHSYIQEAYNKGIRSFIVEILPENYSIFLDAQFIKSPSSSKFLHKAAQAHLRKLKLPHIAITGSNGKTILKEWASEVFSVSYRICKSPKSYNSTLGLSLSILAAGYEHTLGIFEVGISGLNEMDIPSQMLFPELAVLMNIGSAHSAHFPNRECHIKEKIKIAKNAKRFLYFGDDEEVKSYVQRLEIPTYSFGFNVTNTYSIQLLKDKCYTISYPEGQSTIEIRNDDYASLLNACALFAMQHLYGYQSDQIIKGINQLSEVEMRMERIPGIRDNIILNDTYNFDLESLRICLQKFNETSLTKILILTDIDTDHYKEHDINEVYSNIASLLNSAQPEKLILIGKVINEYKEWFHVKPIVNFVDVDVFLDSTEINTLKSSYIIIKGARSFKTEKIVDKLSLINHETCLAIHLGNLEHNVSYFRNLLSPNVNLMLMLKANAYGMGSLGIAKQFSNKNISYFGVAFIDEGVELRKHGITVPILVLNPERAQITKMKEFYLEPEIHSIQQFQYLIDEGVLNSTSKFPIHIKLDTGMHRLGFSEQQIEPFLSILTQYLDKIEVKSIMSHLSSSDSEEGKEFTELQIKKFETGFNIIEKTLGYSPQRHILNTGGIASFNETPSDLARLGIGMYGLSTSRHQPYLMPVVSLSTVISQITFVRKGEGVSYSRKWVAPEDCNIATLPIGYADGIHRMANAKFGEFTVRIGKKHYPVVGSICMDMMMIYLGTDEYPEGSKVIIFDDQESLQNLANASQTISYEILTGISSRIKRIYYHD